MPISTVGVPMGTSGPLSNWICVRRVKFQEIDNHGKPLGKPTFAVIAADDDSGDYADVWRSLENLNKAIEEAGGMLRLLEVDFDVDVNDPVFKDNCDWPKPSRKVDTEESAP